MPTEREARKSGVAESTSSIRRGTAVNNQSPRSGLLPPVEVIVGLNGSIRGDKVTEKRVTFYVLDG